MKALLLFIIFILPITSSSAADMDYGDAAIKRGEDLFKTTCQVCHSLKYLGLEPTLTSDASMAAFGKVPPDLSLITKARGRGDKGARYIRALLTSYNESPEKNSVFPNIAMPPVFAKEDKDIDLKANDVAAFLLHAAEPSADERESLGIYVLAYMIIMTILLYFVNRKVWTRLEDRRTSHKIKFIHNAL